MGISAETRGCYSGESCAMRFWTGGVLWRGLCRKDQEGRMQFLCGRGGRVWSDCRGTGLPLMSCLRTDQSAGAVSSEVDSNHRAGLGWRDSDALQANPSGASTLPCCGRRGRGDGQRYSLVFAYAAATGSDTVSIRPLSRPQIMEAWSLQS